MYDLNKEHGVGTSKIDLVWDRLIAWAGQEFQTKTGKPFTFDIENDGFFPSRTDYRLAKSEFERVLELVPLDGPGEVNHLVRGPSYIWAVLHDPRIRQSDW